MPDDPARRTLLRRLALVGSVGLTADERRLLVSIRREATVEVAELAHETGCVIRSLEIQAGNISPPALGDGPAVVSTGADDESVYAVGTAGD